jgi:ATP-dependent DNA ligase
MVIFFDILLFDDKTLVDESYENRTTVLSKIIAQKPGFVNPRVYLPLIQGHTSQSVPAPFTAI